MSWRHLEEVLKTYSQDEYIGLDQDVLKTSSRRLLKTWGWGKHIRLLKTKKKDIFRKSSRRLHQDECLLGPSHMHLPTLIMWQVVLIFMLFVLSTQKFWLIHSLLIAAQRLDLCFKVIWFTQIYKMFPILIAWSFQTPSCVIFFFPFDWQHLHSGFLLFI